MGKDALIHNYIYQGKIDRTTGYEPFILTSNKLSMAGIEWIYHHKEMHYKIFYNQIFNLENEQENIEISNNKSCYGLGVTFTSPFGPIDLIWGYGPKKNLSDTIGFKAKIDFEDIQPGDIEKTFADIAAKNNKANHIFY